MSDMSDMSDRTPMSDRIPLVEQIDAILPQTQCTKCGYQGCRPYAEAIAAGDAINKCPPGGQAGIKALAALLDKPLIPLDTTHGEELAEKQVAFIREAECIGCTKCIQACPVDAILGAAKLMHTVIADICTGCDLCVAPCPVDCIDMITAPARHYPDAQTAAIAEKQKADLSRLRFQKRNARLQRLADEKQSRRQIKADHQARREQQEAADPVQNPVQAALETLRAQAALQPVEEQRTKLERALVSARERLERADKKVREAERKTPALVSNLLARRQDMQFKLDEIERKLLALDTNKHADIKTVSSTGNAAITTSDRFNEAVSRITQLRSQKSDPERLANGLAVIRQKLAIAQEQFLLAEGEEKHFLAEDIQRLQTKLAEAEKALAEMDGKPQPDTSPKRD